jgi:hypothetical protein
VSGQRCGVYPGTYTAAMSTWNKQRLLALLSSAQLGRDMSHLRLEDRDIPNVFLEGKCMVEMKSSAEILPQKEGALDMFTSCLHTRH